MQANMLTQDRQIEFYQVESTQNKDKLLHFAENTCHKARPEIEYVLQIRIMINTLVLLKRLFEMLTSVLLHSYSPESLAVII